jgi:hypothetical protein
MIFSLDTVMCCGANILARLRQVLSSIPSSLSFLPLILAITNGKRFFGTKLLLVLTTTKTAPRMTYNPFKRMPQSAALSR